MQFSEFNQEQREALMTAQYATAMLGSKDALSSALQAASESVDERLDLTKAGDKIVTPALRDVLQQVKAQVFPAVLASIKGRHANPKTVRSTALGLVALFDAVDRLDAVIDDSFETAEYGETAAPTGDAP